MEYKGYRLMNLYKDAEKDIIDDMKDEIKYLKQKVKEYNYRENEFENEMDAVTLENKNLKREFAKSRQELKESRDILEDMKNMENEELEHLEIKHKSALEDIAKKEEREKEFARVKSISNQVIQGMKEQIKKLEFEVNESNSVKEVSDNISRREIMEANLI